MPEETYIAIDLKSFYASVECVDRQLDPLTTNLVVADPSRTEKTICLAVTPALKAYGIPGRARLFEVVQKVREINEQRLLRLRGRKFFRKSFSAPELATDPFLELDYIIARPRMARYMEISSRIFGIYLKYVAPEHIHVYSVDEVFIQATQYLRLYRLDGRDFARKLIREVLSQTGITATAGVAPNLFLCKVAMDIVAKHIPADRDGVRIAEMDEMSFRRQLWSHRPLTDFWRVGRGYASKLQRHGMYTMGDVARMSVINEELLYKLFGINAELLIDHAWGWEPCTIAAIKAYRPANNSLGNGQVLKCPYPFEKARLVVREMADQLGLRLVEKRLVADQVVLQVGYDIANLQGQYGGRTRQDRYGREIPEGAHGSRNLGQFVSSSRVLSQAAVALFDAIAEPRLLVRRLYVVANHVVSDTDAVVSHDGKLFQPELFPEEGNRQPEECSGECLEKERRRQEAMIAIRNKLGKNAILKGMNLEEGATARERNQQVGGHHV